MPKPNLLDGAQYALMGDHGIDLLLKLAKALSIADEKRFISTEHCRSIFKHHLKTLKVDVPQSQKKEVNKNVS